MPCKLCDERGKTWEGSDPVCAFPGDVFVSRNWNCATMNKLRELAENGSTSESEYCDQPGWSWYGVSWRAGDSSFAVLESPIVEGEWVEWVEWIVMSWYKGRGAVGAAQVFSDETMKPLTLEIAERAIQFTMKKEGTMPNNEIEVIDGDAVIIQPLPVDRCDRHEARDQEFDAPPVPATKLVGLDILQLGQSITIGVYCDSCADEVATELRAALSKGQ